MGPMVPTRTMMSAQTTLLSPMTRRSGLKRSTNETTTKTGLKAFVIVTEGEAQEVPVHWVHYLLTHPSGKQVGLVFTMEPKQAERFGNAAEELVSTFRIDVPAPPAKASPTVKTAPAPKPSPAAATRLPERKPRVAR